MQSTLQLTQHYKQGAFGRVELNHQTKRAIKLFFAIDTTQITYQERPWENEIRKIVFAEEVQAYELAKSCTDLLPHVPKFLCKRSFSTITSESGEDVSYLYLLDCCYEIELIEGRFEKLHDWPRRFDTPMHEVDRITALFRNAGINHTKDADATTSGDRQRIEKVIDFAIRDTYHDEENLRN
jgi:hypothetical protein